MTATTKTITAKKVARYMLLPEIIPRAKELGGAGFGYLAFLIATVYNAVRILPATHPFLNPSNIGQFTIRQAIGEAANNVKISRRNIDQIIIFLAVLAAILLLAMQFLMFVFLLVTGQAFAQEAASFQGLFKTVKPEQDIAFQILDHVFGIPEFFGSNVPTGQPLQTALQTLFHFYNLAILVVAILIFLYFVIVVVAETAQTGVPFGKRFSHIYAPFRLVAAIGLLVPLNYGFNASQYITLAAARAGSGLATNGWLIFNQANPKNPLGIEDKSLIGRPVVPDMTSLAAFFTVAHTCKAVHKKREDIDIDAYVRMKEGPVKLSSTSYGAAMHSLKGANIEILLGYEEDKNGKKTVKPVCGIIKILIHVFDSSDSSNGGEPGGEFDGLGSVGAPQNNNNQGAGEKFMQALHYYGVVALWTNYPKLVELGEHFAKALYPSNILYACADLESENTSACDSGSYMPDSSMKEEIRNKLQSNTTGGVNLALEEARKNTKFNIEQAVLDRGWGGAGIWYNRIAQMNGSLHSAVYDVPAVSRMPHVMRHVIEKNRESNSKTKVCDRYDLNKADKDKIKFPRPQTDRYYAEAMNYAYKYWCDDKTTEAKGITTNMFWDAMHLFFGVKGLFSIQKNTEEDVHPLAQLVTLGKGMIDSAVRNMAYSFVFALGGGILGATEGHMGPALLAMSGFFTSIATVGLTAGFILFYILPFLPFIYFFFAVGKWVKTIFEAMVGAPLWALAHLRIDGDGFPTKASMNGYFLILEIFIRPILAVCGMLGGLAIFTAMAVILNELFEIVVYNVTGTDLAGGKNLSGPAGNVNETTGVGGSVSSDKFTTFRRSIVDEFFFTVVYAIVLYMIALSSFKMVDLVPNNILRWIGSGASSFADKSEDPAQGLTQYAAVGGATIGGKLAGAVNQAGQGVGQAVNAAANIGKK